jgi:IS605 OrfB family transposase
MELTTQLKLIIDPNEVSPLMKRFNEACNWLSNIAFKEKLWHWFPLQKRAYWELRQRYGLSAAASLVIIRKVAYAYRNKKEKKVTFRPLGSIPLFKHVYKDKLVSFYGIKANYSSREGISLPKYPKEGWLIYRDKNFYIHQPIEIKEPEPYPPKGYLGCDLGIKNILVDSDGECYSGAFLNNMRKRHHRLRAKLQVKGTRSSKRLLLKRSKKERRFATDINHQISKRVVAKAIRHSLGIALEDLKGIRARVRFRKAHRRQAHSWAFAQLRSFIEYKARLAGVPVILVNPRKTSITCPICGWVDKANRVTQELFICTRCNYGGLADAVAARNIASWAAGDQPNESRKEVQIPCS